MSAHLYLSYYVHRFTPSGLLIMSSVPQLSTSPMRVGSCMYTDVCCLSVAGFLSMNAWLSLLLRECHFGVVGVHAAHNVLRILPIATWGSDP